MYGFIERFEVDDTAAALHGQGLALATDRSAAPDFPAALSKFTEATDALGVGLGNLDEIEEPQAVLKKVDEVLEGIDNPHLLVQTGRILRDRGTTLARIGLRDDIPEAIAEGYTFVRKSYHKSLAQPLLNASVVRGSEAWGYLRAERGATEGVLGRLATLKVVKGVSDPETAAAYAAEHYEKADEYHRDGGTNKYYAASNAMNAARHERIVGNIGNTLKWAWKALRYSVESIKEDRGNAKDALGTVAVRLSSLILAKSTRKSVLNKL